MGSLATNVIGAMPRMAAQVQQRPLPMPQQPTTMPLQPQMGIGQQVSAAAQGGTTGQDLQALIQSLLAQRQGNQPQVMESVQPQVMPPAMPQQPSQRMMQMPFQFGQMPYFGFQQSPYQNLPFQGFPGQGMFGGYNPFFSYFNNRIY